MQITKKCDVLKLDLARAEEAWVKSVASNREKVKKSQNRKMGKKTKDNRYNK
jgi:hypothetical protein